MYFCYVHSLLKCQLKNLFHSGDVFQYIFYMLVKENLSGATEHCLECHGQFNWLHPKTLSREARYKNKTIRESLEIKRSKWNSRKSNIIRDDGNFIKTNTWTPLLRNINDLESALHHQRCHCKVDMT